MSTSTLFLSGLQTSGSGQRTDSRNSRIDPPHPTTQAAKALASALPIEEMLEIHLADLIERIQQRADSLEIREAELALRAARLKEKEQRLSRLNDEGFRAAPQPDTRCGSEETNAVVARLRREAAARFVSPRYRD